MIEVTPPESKPGNGIGNKPALSDIGYDDRKMSVELCLAIHLLHTAFGRIGIVGCYRAVFAPLRFRIKRHVGAVVIRIESRKIAVTDRFQPAGFRPFIFRNYLHHEGMRFGFPSNPSGSGANEIVLTISKWGRWFLSNLTLEIKKEK